MTPARVGSCELCAPAQDLGQAYCPGLCHCGYGYNTHSDSACAQNQLSPLALLPLLGAAASPLVTGNW